MLPVGVVIPTRNSMDYLPGHVASVAKWADQVAEIIVVDSESTDGTPEFIRNNLKHPNLQIFNRPRGLYQAWNFGVGQVRSPFTYISTIGDIVQPEGLVHLASVAESLQSDVVISPPAFVDAAGKSVPDFHWPIQRLIKNLAITQPRSLSRSETILFALTNGMNSFLGSSASNLYRTRVLQEHPFPLNFGHMGDTAWGISNCADIRVGVTPTTCASFLFHPKETEPDFSALAPELLQLARQVKTSFSGNTELQKDPDIALACEFLAETALECSFQNDINRARREGPSIASNLRAWTARLRRNRQRRRIRRLRPRFRNQQIF